MRVALKTFIAAALIAVGLAGCDFSEQNVDWEPGESLIVVGSVDDEGTGIAEDDPSPEGHPVVIQPVDAYFYIRAFTVDKEYAWSVDGTAAGEMENAEVLNEGEFLRVSFETPGTYTVEVETGSLSGTQTVVVQNES